MIGITVAEAYKSDDGWHTSWTHLDYPNGTIFEIEMIKADVKVMIEAVTRKPVLKVVILECSRPIGTLPA